MTIYTLVVKERIGFKWRTTEKAFRDVEDLGTYMTRIHYNHGGEGPTEDNDPIGDLVHALRNGYSKAEFAYGHKLGFINIPSCYESVSTTNW